MPKYAGKNVKISWGDEEIGDVTSINFEEVEEWERPINGSVTIPIEFEKPLQVRMTFMQMYAEQYAKHFQN